MYGKYCNSNFDLHILSQTRVVYIIFVSDETIAHVGYEGNYSLIEGILFVLMLYIPVSSNNDESPFHPIMTTSSIP